jgi:hypothetical protein
LSLAAFRKHADAEGVAVRVELKFEIKAKAFAQAFGGRRTGKPEADITLRTVL